MHSCSRLFCRKHSKPYTSKSPGNSTSGVLKTNATHGPEQVTSHKGGEVDGGWWRKRLCTNEVAPLGVVCAHAAVDEADQPIKQSVGQNKNV